MFSRVIAGALGAAAAVGGIGALSLAGGAEPSRGNGKPIPDSPPPRILSARYGLVRPPGAPRAGYALRVRARDPDGQIVSISYVIAGPGTGGPALGRGHADGGCGLGGKRNGETEAWTLPVRKLRPGRYRVRVTATSSPCDADGVVQRSSRTFTIRVGGARPRGGRLAVTHRFDLSRANPIEGFVSFLVLRARGSGKVIAQRELRGDLGRRRLTRSLPAGTYELTSYQRTCSANCGAPGSTGTLDPPSQRCTRRISVRPGQTRFVRVLVAFDRPRCTMRLG